MFPLAKSEPLQMAMSNQARGYYLSNLEPSSPQADDGAKQKKSTTNASFTAHRTRRDHLSNPHAEKSIFRQDFGSTLTHSITIQQQQQGARGAIRVKTSD